MKKLATAAVCFSLVVTPLYAAPPPAGPSETAPPSLLEAAENVASSGAFRLQSTVSNPSGTIREDDKKRSAIALAIAGAAAFAGAGLWRWLPCRNAGDVSSSEGLRPNEFGAHTKYLTCFTEDGERKGLETPVKLLLGAGIGLEVVSLFYLIRHLRQDDN